ncbi:MAG: signal peptidase I [Vampirovibrionales bacterium]|nr:signal peptidase I [Vampirovibrionales bacterium]
MRFTEDVKEALHRAQKLARSAKAPHVSERLALLSVVETLRPFSRFDSALRELKIKPRALRDALKSLPDAPAPAASVADPLSSEAGGADMARYPAPLRPLLARLLQRGDASGEALDMDALTQACLQADDPPMREALSSLGLTSASWRGASESLNGRRIAAMPARRFWSALYILREIAELVVIVLTFLVLIREGLGEPRLIPSPSMLPTLQVGDRVIVEKLSHWVRPYQRGDILVFYPPEPEAVIHNDPLSALLRMSGFSALIHNKPDDPVDRAFIKRLIGLPGDTFQVVPNVGVKINGRLLQEPYVAALPELCVSACEPRVIPKGQYFMMGDNRNDSKDSRYFGYQPASRVLGRAVFRIFPLNRIGTL